MNKPADLKLAEIKVGSTASFTVTITRQQVRDFLQLSGDFNPLHSDEKYAQTTKFEKVVIPGMLLASYFSRLVGMHLPGKRALYLSQTLQFKQPAFIGDKVVIHGEVTAVSQKLGLITLVTGVVRSHDQKTLVGGETKVLYLK